MKKFLVGGLFAVVGLAAFAGTCNVSHVGFNTIGSHDTAAGQVDNNSGVNILEHKFKVAFLNDNNDVVETKTINGCLRSLQDGSSDFFSTAASASAGDTTHSLSRLANFSEDPSFKIGTTTSADLSVTTTNIARTGTSLKVAGTVKNNGDDLITSPAVCMVARDTDGNVLVVGKDDSLDDIDTGVTRTFSVTMTVPSSGTTPKTVDVYVDGIDDNNDKVIEPQSDLDNTVKTCGTATTTATANATETSAAATSSSTPTDTATSTTIPAAATNTPAATSTPCGG